MLCFLSDVGTPRLLSLPRSVHRTGDQILSFTARRALFLLPSKKKTPPLLWSPRLPYKEYGAKAESGYGKT